MRGKIWGKIGVKTVQKSCAVCGEVNVWLSAARVFAVIDVVVLQHYFCRVLVIPTAMVFRVWGPSDPPWLSLVLKPNG